METIIQNDAAAPSESWHDVWGGRQLIQNLQCKARAVLDPIISADAQVAVLDYPNYANVGDSLIWLGEVAYLSSRKISPAYVCDRANYESGYLSGTMQDRGVILLQGGGNFGSLWTHIHDFRLQVLRDFPRVPVIQLPQSLHFENEEVLEQTRQVISRHHDFTLLTRDQPSYDFALEHFDCKVFLCPDMAFFIGPINSSRKPGFDRFILSRTDHEKVANWLDGASSLVKGSTMDCADWLDQWPLERILNRIQQQTEYAQTVLDPSHQMLLRLWQSLAKARLYRGRTLLERGRVVISDRLHVHILSILLDKPHILIDNSYGKLSNFHEAWTKPYAGVRFVEDFKSALEVASEFDDRQEQLGSRGGQPRHV